MKSQVLCSSIDHITEKLLEQRKMVIGWDRAQLNIECVNEAPSTLSSRFSPVAVTAMVVEFGSPLEQQQRKLIWGVTDAVELKW